MARAHALMAQEGWKGAELRALAAAELAAHAGRNVLAGPPVRLLPEAVQPLGMLLHELAGNATLHGALSRAEGRVTLTWEVAPEGGLRLCWYERGGPRLPGPPDRIGFGSRLLA